MFKILSEHTLLVRNYRESLPLTEWTFSVTDRTERPIVVNGRTRIGRNTHVYSNDHSLDEARKFYRHLKQSNDQ